MIKIINTSDNPYAFRYYDGKGDLKQIDIGANSDHNIVGRKQPTVKISNEIWGKIKAKADPLVGDGVSGTGPLRVMNA